MGGVEADGLMERVEHTGSLFIRQQAGKGEPGMIVDGDVETFDACAWIAHSSIAGGAHAGLCEAAQLLDVQMKKVARSVAFVAHNGRLWRIERSETIKTVAAEHAGKRGLGKWQHRHDLGVRAARPAQLHDPGFELL